MQKLETISSIHGSYKLYIHFGSEKKKKKKERPLKELYKCHSSNPFFLALRSHSLTTNTHHLNTHTHRQQRTGDDRNTALRTNTHNSTQDKKKTVQHHCLQHSSQGLCTHPRLNQKKRNCSTNHPKGNRPPSFVTERVIRRHALQSGTDTLFHVVLGPPHSFSFSTLNWPGLGAGRVDFRFAYVSNKQSISLALKNTAASSARRPWEKKKRNSVTQRLHGGTQVARRTL